MGNVANGKTRKWSSKWSSMTRSLTGTAGRVTDKARGAAQSADNLVRHKPWHAAGLTALMAAGAGFLTAMASGRVLRGRSR
jgi:ElaB/YqjD/DUF883 family membrane-anchored ribosome-binding protein